MSEKQDFKEMSQDELIKMFNESKGSQQMKDLKMTDAEQDKMMKNFQNPEFVKLFNQFARELQEEQTQKDLDTMLKNAEAMSQAQETVDQATQLKQKMQQKERVMMAKGKKMTAKDRIKIKEQQKISAQLKEDIEVQKQQQEKQKRFEELYKKHVDQRKLKQAMQTQGNFNNSTQNSGSSEKPFTVSDAGQMTAEDYKRMEELLKQADEFAKAREKTPEQLAKEIAEAAQKRDQTYQPPELKESIPLPYKEVFIQDIEFADYLNGEQLNLEKIRGYKAVQLRAAIPDGYNKDSLKLEVTKHEVKLEMEANGKIYRLNKNYQFQLNENSAAAKMRIFNEADSKKYGCSQYLELTINIDRNALETIKYYTDMLKQRQFVEAGPSIAKTPEEIAQEVVQNVPQQEVQQEQKSKFEISPEIRAKALEYEQTQASIQNIDQPAQPVQPVQRTEDGAKTLHQKYAENLKKQQKTVNLDEIQAPVATENKIFNFVFRNRIFYMQNKDLTWQ